MMQEEQLNNEDEKVIISKEKSYAPIQLDVGVAEKEILHALKIYDPEDPLLISNKVEFPSYLTQRFIKLKKENAHNPKLYEGIHIVDEDGVMYFEVKGEKKIRSKHFGQDHPAHKQGGNIVLGGEMFDKYMVRQIEAKYLNVRLKALSSGLPCEKIVKDKEGKFRIYKDHKTGLYRVYSHIVPGVSGLQLDRGDLLDYTRSIVSAAVKMGIDGLGHMQYGGNRIIKHEGGNMFSFWMIDFDSSDYASSLSEKQYVKYEETE